jgi:DNA-directed RNA polymerase alpha subunit
MQTKIEQNKNIVVARDIHSRTVARGKFIQFIHNQNLSVRATNVLLQNCYSLEDFISLTEEKLFSFPSCGKKTVREILSFLVTNSLGRELPPPLSPEEELASPPKTSTIELLPLFSSKRLPEFAAEQLHPDFQGGLKNKDLSLSASTLKTLDGLKLETIGEVMLVPGSELLKQSNFGKKCLRELQDVVLELCMSGAQKEHLSWPPTEHSLATLPLFSSQKLINISVDDFHMDFHATTKLSDLNISPRTSNVLNDLGMTSIGEAMLTPGNDLLRIKNFGHKSLKELRRIVRSLCLPDIQKEKQKGIDYSSYEAMVESFLKQCVKSRRDQQLFKRRLCFTEGKAPTLEELGQQFGITRERTRQILNKGFNKLRIKENIDRLHSFWKHMDKIVAQGGGLIKLGKLSLILQTNYEWQKAPFPPALGQFLLFREPNAVLKQDDDLIELPSPCQDCNLPGEHLRKLDFEATESFHIDVVADRLSDLCQNHCPRGKPVDTLFPAFIERLVENSKGLFIIFNNVVLPYKRWREKYCDNLEDVACQVLENHGEPMHFREIASGIRQANENFKDISDHNVHSAIMRYDSIEIINRGTYGLKSWGLGGYRSVTTAIEDLIDEKGLPQRRQNIINSLQEEFLEQNISASLTVETRFTSIGDGFYDRTKNWKQRTCQGLIKLLPEAGADLANHVVAHNNSSYEMVMAFIVIRRMDGNGFIYLNRLKDMFYNFYRSRHKKGLVVELDSSEMSRIAELAPADLKNKATNRPLENLLHTGFFQSWSQNGVGIKLADHLVSILREDATRNTLLVTILKAIDDYFLKISPAVYSLKTQSPTQVAKSRQASKQHETQEEPKQNLPSTISIKKKKRAKIKL